LHIKLYIGFVCALLLVFSASAAGTNSACLAEQSHERQGDGADKVVLKKALRCKVAFRGGVERNSDKNSSAGSKEKRA